MRLQELVLVKISLVFLWLIGFVFLQRSEENGFEEPNNGEELSWDDLEREAASNISSKRSHAERSHQHESVTKGICKKIIS